MKRLIYWLAKKYYGFLYREADDTVCCCGDYMSKPYHDNHMPRSMKEYAITSSADRWKP